MGKISGKFWGVSVLLLLSLVAGVKSVNGGLKFYEESAVSSGSIGTVGKLVKKEERVPLVATEFGEISAIDINDGTGMDTGTVTRAQNYHIQFITLEPNSVFLPVLLHADMVFYVQTGSGKIRWTDGDELKRVNLQQGDVYRLRSGTLFYLHSSLEDERPRLRIIAIFANLEEQLQEAWLGPYSSISDLVRGFDKRILQAAFQVSEEVVEELTSATDTPAIVHAEPKKRKFWQQKLLFVNAFLGIQRYSKQLAENKKKDSKTYNFFNEKPDFKNCNGWSTVVTKHKLHALHGSNIGVFMVNLTKGSMMGPHWNPMATEVSVVLEGEGMVRVVCPSTLKHKACRNSRFNVEEGDVFTVPRFHPMAQTSFNNGSLVFMGFSSTTKKNHPQFLAGKASVLHTLSKGVLSASFNVSNTTIDQLLAAQKEAIILDCTSCAEEQEILLEDEIERARQKEEERRKEEEEARRKEEEERKRREEEARREKEEEKRRQEEEQRREEEERERQEEEARRREEEEAKRRQEEEEKKRREEEEKERRRKEEEEEAKRRQEEEEKKRREEEEKERRQKEEDEKRRRQEEEARRREEEEEEREKEEEEERQREEEKERQREEEKQRKQEEKEREREEEEQRQQEEEARQKEEERRRVEKERRRQAEEKRQREEEEERQREEEEEWRREEKRRRKEKREQEEHRRRQEEEAAREEEERRRQQERGEEEEETEEEIARREEEERREWQRQAEEAAGKRREGGRRRSLRRKTKLSNVHW